MIHYEDLCIKSSVKLIFLFYWIQPITDDDVDRIALCLRVLSENAPLMSDIFNTKCRQALSVMLATKADEEKEVQKVVSSYLFQTWNIQPYFTRI